MEHLTNPNTLLSLAGGIVLVGLVTSILLRGSAFAQVVTAITNGFAKALGTAISGSA